MATFHTLLQMMDTLHTEEDCRVYLENVRWNGKPICPHVALFPKTTTNLHKTESSKDYISVVIVESVLPCVKELCLRAQTSHSRNGFMRYICSSHTNEE